MFRRRTQSPSSEISPWSNHARSLPAAIAAECVQELGDDDTYFAYVSSLFSGAGLTDAALQTEAEALGIDGAEFVGCFADSDGLLAAEIEADIAAGRAAGVRGTPRVFVNGRSIVGAQAFEVFKGVVDQELNRTQHRAVGAGNATKVL